VERGEHRGGEGGDDGSQINRDGRSHSLPLPTSQCLSYRLTNRCMEKASLAHGEEGGEVSGEQLLANSRAGRLENACGTPGPMLRAKGRVAGGRGSAPKAGQ